MYREKVHIKATRGACKCNRKYGNRVEARYGVLEKYCFWPQKLSVLSILLVRNNSEKISEKKKIDFGEWGDYSTIVIYCRRSGGNT